MVIKTTFIVTSSSTLVAAVPIIQLLPDLWTLHLFYLFGWIVNITYTDKFAFFFLKSCKYGLVRMFVKCDARIDGRDDSIWKLYFSAEQFC